MSKESKKEKEKQKGEIAPTTEKGLATREESLTRGMDSIFGDFKRSFDNLMAPFMPFGRSLYEPFERLPMRYPLCDIMDQGNDYIVKIELPGLNKDQVNVEVNKDTLVLAAQMEKSENKDEKNYIHRERSFSRMQRVINFPEEVDPNKVEGVMKDGILELKVTKKEPKPEEKLRKIELK